MIVGVGPDASARVTVVPAPRGSGKTVLLRSWIGEAGLSGRAAWVPVGRGKRDPQQFWLLVLGALRQTAPALELVQPVTAAPDLDGWVIVERLLTDLAPLEDRVPRQCVANHHGTPDDLRTGWFASRTWELPQLPNARDSALGRPWQRAALYSKPGERQPPSAGHYRPVPRHTRGCGPARTDW
jgi:hypothetical protein